LCLRAKLPAMPASQAPWVLAMRVKTSQTFGEGGRCKSGLMSR
jgi:hypothetical protein